MSNVNRIQAGVPTGGQFAPTSHGESDVDLYEPALVADIMPEDGDSVELPHEQPAQGGLYDRLELVGGSNPVIEGAVRLDLTQACPDDHVGDDADRYLNDHIDEIGKFLTDNYGMSLGGGGDDWSEQEAEFVIDDFDEDDNIGDLVLRAETDPGAVRLHNALNGGYQSGSFYEDLRSHLDRADREAPYASWSSTDSPASTAEKLSGGNGDEWFTDDVGVRWTSGAQHSWSANEMGSRIRFWKSFNDGGYKWAIERANPRAGRLDPATLNSTGWAGTAAEALEDLRKGDASLRRMTNDTSGWTMTSKLEVPQEY